jgi:hypothetical protein
MYNAPVQDTHREDMRIRNHRESTDLPHTGAAALAVAQEGPCVVTVVVPAPGQAGTSACTACPDMANLHLTRITCDYGKNKIRVSWYLLTALASATLLNLNGLKSSLTCTGVFLSTIFPKNGLGTGGEVEAYRKRLHEISRQHIKSTYGFRLVLGRRIC